jgi:hypothetical protein
MNLVEQFYADHADEHRRELLARYAYAWASRPVQKLARNLVGLDLLAAVGVAQRLQRARTKRRNTK